MQSRVDLCTKRHQNGYNCAQAVACAYADLVGMDEETMFKVTEGLGLGQGAMLGTCGAVAGACVLAGMKNSCGDLSNPNSKGSTYKLVKEITETFKADHGTVICRELKGVDTGKVVLSCPDCIRNAAALAEKVLFSEE
ncbi:MAG: C-GCAxxG-C-C family protein [Lachnospiraceae bacterium]|nr:C-GCAxxG-C-C family protein [Lachnospiraceae bacterium]